MKKSKIISGFWLLFCQTESSEFYTVWQVVYLQCSCDRQYLVVVCRLHSSVYQQFDNETRPRMMPGCCQLPLNSADSPARDPGPSSTCDTVSRRIAPSQSASASADTACRLYTRETFQRTIRSSMILFHRVHGRRNTVDRYAHKIMNNIEKNMHIQQSSSGQVPTYDIDITVSNNIIQKNSVQHDITVTELDSHARRTSESSFMALTTNMQHSCFLTW